jgi:hypothetical protein
MATNEPFIMLPVSVAFDPTLSPYAVRLIAALEHFSGQHLTCWPGYTALAALVGCTPRWIPVLLNKLVEAELLLIQFRPGKTNIYTLLKRVSRQPRPTPEVKPDPPRKSNSYKQKPQTKTNNNYPFIKKNPNESGAMAFMRRHNLLT